MEFPVARISERNGCFSYILACVKYTLDRSVCSAQHTLFVVRSDDVALHHYELFEDLQDEAQRIDANNVEVSVVGAGHLEIVLKEKVIKIFVSDSDSIDFDTGLSPDQVVEILRKEYPEYSVVTERSDS